MANTFDPDAAIKEYLDSIGLVPESIAQLSGGSANFIWRVNIDTRASHSDVVPKLLSAARTPEQASTVIVKHAEPYVALNPGTPFPVDRVLFEARALNSFHRHLSEAASRFNVSLPALHHASEEQCMLLMSDAGLQNLKNAYATLTQDQAQDVGTRLGGWLAHLHQNTKAMDIGAMGNTTAKNIYRYAYTGLQGALQHWGFAGEHPELGTKVNEVFGGKLATDDECVCMGDFWPGNVILGEARLSVVDWEMVRRGCGATDCGQFAAEALLLDTFRPSNHGLTKAFVQSYLETLRSLDAPPSTAFVKRMGVHCGTHLVFWPSRVKWGSGSEADNEKAKELARHGMRMIEMAMAGDVKWLDEFTQ